MFRVSPHPSSVAITTVTAASGTGHNIGATNSLQRRQIGQIWPHWHRYYDLYRRLRLQFLILLMMGTVTPETCSDSAVHKYLHTVASSWIFINIEL